MSFRLTPTIEGNAGGETLLFVQGWPDDASLWDEAVAALAATYRCVRVTLPNFGGDKTTRWGHDTEEIVEALAAVLRAVSAGGRVTLVLHDWGCYWGHAVHHRCPELVARVVGLDVAPHYEPRPSAMLGIITYQWWLFGAFVIDGPIGDWMTRSFAKRGGAPAKRENINAWMNYPYRNIWADLFTGRARRLTKGYWPDCPLLFIYGKNKPFPFHSAAWVEHVRKVGGEVVGLACGHWVTREPSFVGNLTRWLEATSERATASAVQPS